MFQLQNLLIMAKVDIIALPVELVAQYPLLHENWADTTKMNDKIKANMFLWTFV